MAEVRVGLIGTGAIARANHVPGFASVPEARITALCDANPETVEAASRETGITATFTRYEDLLEQGAVDAVVISTPNFLHHPIAMEAIRRGKHVMCEKPLAMTTSECREMWLAAERAGVRHMTAFTYRFVPGMRYAKHLVDSGFVGEPYHFRASRIQDFQKIYLAWRQTKALAATGELGDMLSHRIDFAHYLVGRIARLTAGMKQILKERRDPAGAAHPSDVDDWVAIIAEFERGSTGVLESTKMAAGYSRGMTSHDYAEVNGAEGTVIYTLAHPNEVRIGRPGAAGLETQAVPESFLKPPGSPRDVRATDPLVGFRYDQNFEFVQAILEQRPCQPSFLDGLLVQLVMDAVITSSSERRWVEVESPGVLGG